MGLWEGVPLRVVIWLARPIANLRRVFYYGYHNDDPKQLFRSSLPIGRVLEDPPGELPVILCYKLNGEFISGKRGGPVRMVVPEAYGFKSVKWLQRVVLTNHYGANDTYQPGQQRHRQPDEDVRPLRSRCRRPRGPASRSRSRGIAQVGVSGLAKVQYWLHPAGEPLPRRRPALHARRLARRRDPAAARRLGRRAARRRLARHAAPVRPGTGPPRQWPLRYTVAHWAAELPALRARRATTCAAGPSTRTASPSRCPAPSPRAAGPTSRSCAGDRSLAAQAPAAAKL